MKTAVVILNWNGAALLREFLPSVVAYSAAADVFVADNASTDDSLAVLQSEFPSIQIIRNDRNYGFAEGYNRALQRVDAELLVLLNSDVEVTPNWLDPVIAAFEKDEKLAIAQPKIRDYKNKPYFEYAGAAGGFLDQYAYPFCRGRIFDTVEKDEGQYDDDCEISWASGACFFIRKSVFDNLAGFDAAFFAHMEEIDLCWRARNRGLGIRYLAGSTVYHLGGATLQQGNPRKTFLNFRNSLCMMLKNLPGRRVIPVIFVRMLLDGVAGVQFLFQGKLIHTMAILNAHFSFYGNLSAMLKKRSVTPHAKYYKVKSIVYNYFIKKQRTFTKVL